MFERYTEKARRVIFFARYEASQFGSPYIETEHLLLGLLREDKALTNRLLRSRASVEAIRKQIEKHTTIGEKVSTSVDLPLSNECKRVVAYAAEEAERLGHKHIGTEHLLLGILREEGSFGAAILTERGLKLETVRDELARVPNPIPETLIRGSGAAVAATAVGDFTRDLTQAAAEGELGSLVGREQELDAVIEVLSGSVRANPLLVGERGVGKSAIIEGLAVRMADGAAPGLAERRLVALDTATVAQWALNRGGAAERVNQTIKSLTESAGVILFVDNLELFVSAFAHSGSALAENILKHWLTQAKLQCIGTCTFKEYAALLQTAPWVVECFKAIHVSPPDPDAAIGVLRARKQKFEALHGVTYSDDALACAVESEGRYLPEGRMPGKALELLDAAGARVKLRQTALPEEVLESMKRIRFIMHRMESAIANHEFEKARFYSDEEKKERENLRILREQHHLDEGSGLDVTRADVEEVIERWGKYPFAEG